MSYRVRFYRGDYRDRQLQANTDRCVAYAEHHFNSSSNGAASYAVAVVGSNASQTSKNWARWYSRATAAEFDIGIGGDVGVLVGGYDGRGDGNLRWTQMPAVLLEPLFASHPRHAEWIRGASGQRRLAQILCESIQRFFPSGGLVGFSVGHKYKTSSPGDRGSAVLGGGFEGDFAEAVLEQAAALLEKAALPGPGREIRVMRAGELLYSERVDEDVDVRWNPVRGVLEVGENAG